MPACIGVRFALVLYVHYAILKNTGTSSVLTGSIVILAQVLQICNFLLNSYWHSSMHTATAIIHTSIAFSETGSAMIHTTQTVGQN